MDSFEFNKIAGAVLAALLLWFGTKTIADGIYSHPLKKPGYVIAVAKHGDDKKVEKEKPFPELLAAADPQAGRKELQKKCSGCHTFTKDAGGKKSGPKLWGVFGRDVAAVDGYKYSGAMKNKGGKWTIEELNKFLENPKKHIQGTKMAFRGIKSSSQRAALIKFLETMK